MTRYVVRRTAQVVQLENTELYRWSPGQPEPLLPISSTKNWLNLFVWKPNLVKSDFKLSTEYARVFFTFATQRVESKWATSRYRYKELATHVSAFGEGGRFNFATQGGGFVTAPAWLLEEFATKVASDSVQQYASLAALLAEVVDTARYISDRSFDLASALRAVRKGNWRKLKNILSKYDSGIKALTKGSRNAAGAWLEYQYAVKPLVNDITTATALYNGQLLKFENKLLTLSARGSFNETFTPPGVKRIDSTCRWNGKATYLIEEGAIAYVTLLGLADFPGAIWEGVRWSVFVDWMFPVGEWLSSLTPTLGMSLVDCYVSAQFKEIHLQNPKIVNGTAVVLPPGVAEGWCRTKVEPRAHLRVDNPLSSIPRIATTASLIRLNASKKHLFNR